MCNVWLCKALHFQEVFYGMSFNISSTVSALHHAIYKYPLTSPISHVTDTSHNSTIPLQAQIHTVFEELFFIGLRSEGYVEKFSGASSLPNSDLNTPALTINLSHGITVCHLPSVFLLLLCSTFYNHNIAVFK
jgi:hypothetical protein